MSSLDKIRNRMADAYKMPLMMTRQHGMYELVMTFEQEQCVEASHAFAKYLYEAPVIPDGVCSLILDELFNPLELPKQNQLITFRNSNFFREFLLQYFSRWTIDAPESVVPEAVMTFGLLRFLELVHKGPLEVHERTLYLELYSWLKTKGMIEL